MVARQQRIGADPPTEPTPRASVKQHAKPQGARTATHAPRTATHVPPPGAGPLRPPWPSFSLTLVRAALLSHEHPLHLPALLARLRERAQQRMRGRVRLYSCANTTFAFTLSRRDIRRDPGLHGARQLAEVEEVLRVRAAFARISTADAERRRCGVQAEILKGATLTPESQGPVHAKEEFARDSLVSDTRVRQKRDFYRRASVGLRTPRFRLRW